MASSLRRQRAGLFAVAVAVAAGTLSATAAAETPRESAAEARAKQHVRKANDAFRAGRYDEATAEFEAGYALVPLPAFVLNMGHAQRQAGHAARARDYYQRFLRLEPKSPQRGDVEKIIAELDAGAAGPPRAPPPASGSAARPTAALAVGEDSEVPGALKLTVREPVAQKDDGGPAFYQQWWFWGVVAGVVVASAAAFFVLRSGGTDYTASGTWGTLGR